MSELSEPKRAAKYAPRLGVQWRCSIWFCRGGARIVGFDSLPPSQKHIRTTRLRWMDLRAFLQESLGFLRFPAPPPTMLGFPGEEVNLPRIARDYLRFSARICVLAPARPLRSDPLSAP